MIFTDYSQISTYLYLLSVLTGAVCAIGTPMIRRPRKKIRTAIIMIVLAFVFAVVGTIFKNKGVTVDDVEFAIIHVINSIKTRE